MKLLIHTDPQLRKYIPNDQLTAATLADYVLTTQSRYLVPILGETFLTELLEVHHSTEPTPTVLEQLLELLCRATAKLAFVAYIPVGNVQISGSGIHIQSNDHQKTAFGWQVKKLEDSLRHEGHLNLDLALDYLWSKRDETLINSWKSAEVFTNFNSLLVRTEKEFSVYYNLGGSRLTYMAFRTELERFEREDLITLLGQTLAETLRTQVTGDSVSAENAKILPLVREIEVCRSAARYLPIFSIEASVFGLQRHSTHEDHDQKLSQPADRSEQRTLIDKLAGDALRAEKRLLEILNASPDDYPSFKTESPHYFDSSTSEAPNKGIPDLKL